MTPHSSSLQSFLKDCIMNWSILTKANCLVMPWRGNASELPIYQAACPQANCVVENVSLWRRFYESRTSVILPHCTEETNLDNKAEHQHLKGVCKCARLEL
ncbi:hypothetical protein SADUNF_Sadunf08G0024400 [Salix dunnii]|uniref:Uncharacterized protein n=1 Tax=Salix dunnii TaxID=1413687 RepID=A0A835JWL2_9ROSI|nr:hypothetical protein SADUNF_Sadunf08G0024400 [Salix dunnii]